MFWGFEPKRQRCEALVRLREVMTWTSFNRADHWRDEPIRWQSQDNCDCDCNRSFMTASEFYWDENQSRKNIAPRLHCCRVCLSTVSHWCVTLCLICITQSISCSSLQLIPPESNSYYLAHLETISISSSVRLAEGRSSVSSSHSGIRACFWQTNRRSLTWTREHLWHATRAVFFEVRKNMYWMFWIVAGFLIVFQREKQ